MITASVVAQVATLLIMITGAYIRTSSSPKQITLSSSRIMRYTSETPRQVVWKLCLGLSLSLGYAEMAVAQRAHEGVSCGVMAESVRHSGRQLIGRHGRIRSRLMTFCPECPSGLQLLHQSRLDMSGQRRGRNCSRCCRPKRLPTPAVLARKLSCRALFVTTDGRLVIQLFRAPGRSNGRSIH